MTAARTFWLAMAYACSRCGFEVEYLLEEGCEGPRETHVTVPRELVRQWRGPGPAPATTPATSSGRIVVPVPFIARACPRCQGDPPWDPAGGVLQHVRWNQDRVLEPRFVGTPAQPHFLYPDDGGRALDACGEDVWVEPAGAS